MHLPAAGQPGAPPAGIGSGQDSWGRHWLGVDKGTIRVRAPARDLRASPLLPVPQFSPSFSLLDGVSNLSTKHLLGPVSGAPPGPGDSRMGQSLPGGQGNMALGARSKEKGATHVVWGQSPRATSQPRGTRGLSPFADALKLH